MEVQIKPGYKQTEVGVIPEDWVVKNFQDITEVITCGLAATPKYVAEGRGFPFLSSTNVKNGRVIWKNFKYISPDLHKQLYRNNPPKIGDILYSRVGTIGEATVIGDDIEFSIYVSLTLIKPKIIANSYYLCHLLNSSFYKKRANDQVYIGGGVGNLNVEVVRNYPIVLPPTLAEQERIANALSDVDGLIEGLQRLIDKKKLVKQGAMQALLTGKTRLPGFRGEWVSHTLESFVSLRKLRVNPRLLEQSKFCIELEHIEPASGRLISSTTTNQQSSLKSVFKSGDILFGKLRAYLRKYWQADREGLCSTEFWVFLTNTATLNSSYFFQVVKTDAFIDVASSSYGTHMPRSDWNVVKEYEIRIPPLEEQEAIATTLSDMDAEIEALEAKLAKYRQIKQGMMQELLTGKTRLVEPSQGA